MTNTRSVLMLSNFRVQEIRRNIETKRRGHKETGSLVDSKISRPRKDIRPLSFCSFCPFLSFPRCFPFPCPTHHSFLLGFTFRTTCRYHADIKDSSSSQETRERISTSMRVRRVLIRSSSLRQTKLTLLYRICHVSY